MAILTISREYGAGGREIGRRVARRLRYEYVDKEKLFQDLDRQGRRWGEVARQLDEVCPTFWERHDWQYRGYIALMESFIFDLAARDNVVLIGRGGFWLLREVPHCLKVRLVAPLEVRLERIMLQESLDQNAARALLRRVDEDRACYLKANYDKAWEAQSNYDLVLNTGALSYDQVVEMLCQTLAAKDGLATDEARARLADQALAHRLKAKLATDARILLPTLEVFWADDGALVVEGVIHNPKEQELVKAIAREAADATPVRFELKHR